MIYASILAGGKGSRFGSQTPKQFIKINGEEIILHTVRAFCESGLFDRLLVCVPQDYADFTADLFASVNMDVDVVIGGSERFESLEKCCEHIQKKYGVCDDDILISQDSVRPFATDDMISDCIKGVREVGFATAAIPLSDTIVQDIDGEMSVPDRDAIHCIQTPQGFYIADFLNCYSALSPDDKSALTDASKVYILNCRPVKFSKGDRLNIKITNPEDLTLAKAIFESRKKNS